MRERKLLYTELECPQPHFLGEGGSGVGLA